MVARFTEMPAPWAVDTPAAPGSLHPLAGCKTAPLIPEGQLLRARASTLAGVRLGGRGIPSFEGMPLRLESLTPSNTGGGFLKGRIFAVIADDGSMCLRLPKTIADDLIDNGLCVRAGRNQLTWPTTTPHQLEVSWRILLHAYWAVAGTPPRHARRLWSEWVINH